MCAFCKSAHTFSGSTSVNHQKSTRRNRKTAHTSASDGWAKKALVRSGHVYMGYGFLRGVGMDGRYWSHSGVALPTAYYLLFGAGGVNPSDGPFTRYYGFSLRCLQEQERCLEVYGCLTAMPWF